MVYHGIFEAAFPSPSYRPYSASLAIMESNRGRDYSAVRYSGPRLDSLYTPPSPTRCSFRLNNRQRFRTLTLGATRQWSSLPNSWCNQSYILGSSSRSRLDLPPGPPLLGQTPIEPGLPPSPCPPGHHLLEYILVGLSSVLMVSYCTFWVFVSSRLPTLEGFFVRNRTVLQVVQQKG